jgi:hypothetical protein
MALEYHNGTFLAALVNAFVIYQSITGLGTSLLQRGMACMQRRKLYGMMSFKLSPKV